MLPKKNRISVELFDTIGKSGKRISSPFFSFAYSLENAKIPRFAVVVGKKKLPHAVDRNTIRRKIYNILNSHLADIKPVYGIFYLQPISFTAPSEKLEEEIIQILTKTGLIENKVNS